APAYDGALVAGIRGVAVPVDAVVRRDDHIFQRLALGQARVVEQDAANELAAPAQHTAVAQPGGADDGHARLHLAGRADVDGPGDVDLVEVDAGVQAHPDARAHFAARHVHLG